MSRLSRRGVAFSYALAAMAMALIGSACAGKQPGGWASERPVSPLTDVQFYHLSSNNNDKNPPSIRPVINLFPEFFVSESGYANFLPGSVTSVSSESRVSESARLGRIFRLGDRSSTSTTLLVEITPSGQRLDLGSTGLEEKNVYRSDKCDVYVVSDGNRATAMHIWIKYNRKISLSDLAIYKCFASTFSYSYDLSPQADQELFFSRPERLPGDKAGCTLFSEEGFAADWLVRSDDSRPCRTPHPRFTTMTAIIARQAVPGKCGSPSDVLCRSRFAHLESQRQAQDYGNAWQSLWERH